MFGGSSRFLLLFNAVALLAIAGGVAFGIAASGPPARILEQEAAIIAVGLVYATAAVWIRSIPWGGILPVRLLLVLRRNRRRTQYARRDGNHDVNLVIVMRR